MDNRLVHNHVKRNHHGKRSLNPYCNGQPTSTNCFPLLYQKRQVLILIVMDNRLVLFRVRSNRFRQFCLNPYCNGQPTSTYQDRQRW